MVHPFSRTPRLLRAALAALLLTTAACSPSLAPLYRDYEVAPDETPAFERVRAALQDAGWELKQAEIPNLVVTEEKTLRQWGLYRVEVRLEAAAVGQDHVRLFLHPYRDYVIGGRSKIPFLKKSLRAQLLPGLNEAFEKHGLHVVGTPMQRDRVARGQ